MIEKIVVQLHEIKLLLQLSKEVLTLNEFCLYSGLSKEQVYKLTSGSKLTFYRPFGKKIYFRKDEVINALLQNPVRGDQSTNEIADRHFLTSKKAA